MITKPSKYLVALCAALSFSSAFAAPASEENAMQFISRANARVAKAAALKNKWEGPTSGPKLVQGKKVIFIAGDMRDAGTFGVYNGVREAAAPSNWMVLPIDCRGQCVQGAAIVKQALDQKPDAIILAGVDAASQAKGIEAATAAKVPVIGWHASTKPGAVEGLFTNVTNNYKEAAQIAALYGVVESNNKVGIVIFTDSSNPYLAAKSQEVVDTLKQCDTCRVLSVEELPFSVAPARMPKTVDALVKKYGSKWTHIIVINDFYLDLIEKPATMEMFGENKVRAISAGDGSANAYKRIRANNVQVGTVPEPLSLHGWQLVDEINRALTGGQPSGYVTPTHLVTSQNIAYDGGPKNTFEPSFDFRAQYHRIWGR